MLEIGMSTIGLGALVFLLYVLFINKDLKIINMKTNNGQESKKSEPLKVVRLYTDSGMLLKSYEGVYLSHWDKKICHLDDVTKFHMKSKDYLYLFEQHNGHSITKIMTQIYIIV